MVKTGKIKKISEKQEGKKLGITGNFERKITALTR